MQDEGASTYGAVIDQMTLGHQFILNNFGAIPSKGWHIGFFHPFHTLQIIYK